MEKTNKIRNEKDRIDKEIIDKNNRKMSSDLS